MTKTPKSKGRGVTTRSFAYTRYQTPPRPWCAWPSPTFRDPRWQLSGGGGAGSGISPTAKFRSFPCLRGACEGSSFIFTTWGGGEVHFPCSERIPSPCKRQEKPQAERPISQNVILTPDIPQSEISATEFCDSGGSLGKEMGEKMGKMFRAFSCLICCAE